MPGFGPPPLPASVPDCVKLCRTKSLKFSAGPRSMIAARDVAAERRSVRPNTGRKTRRMEVPQEAGGGPVVRQSPDLRRPGRGKLHQPSSLGLSGEVIRGTGQHFVSNSPPHAVPSLHTGHANLYK